MTTANKSLFRLGYRPELDGLRAIAVVTVVLTHLSLIGTGADLRGAMADHTSLGFSGGFYGVDIFFVLSGFLITSLLLQEYDTWRQIDFKAFYIRRALRLGPAMLITLAGCALYLLFAEQSTGAFDWYSVLYSALYLSNFALIFYGLRLGMLTPTWSLSVEEQFYSIWPWIVTWFTARSTTFAAKFIIYAIIVTWIVRALLYAGSWKFYSWPMFGAASNLLFARADGLLSGSLVALAANCGWLPDPKRFALPLKLLSCFCALTVGYLLYAGSGEPTGLQGELRYYFFYAFVSVATAAFIVTLLTSAPKVMIYALRSAPMVWVGKVSYGVYLFHVPIFALTPVRLLGIWGSVAVSILIVFGLAGLSYHFIERRFLDLRSTLGVPRAAKLAQV